MINEEIEDRIKKLEDVEVERQKNLNGVILLFVGFIIGLAVGFVLWGII